MSDIELYKTGTNDYDRIQKSRPDYTKAVDEIVELAAKYTNKEITIVDFCCGTGSVTKQIAEAIGNLHKVILVDINEGFLKIARASNIKTDILETKLGDILTQKFEQEADIALSIFAYHHVPDKDKEKYIEQILSVLKSHGILILAEIYLPDKVSSLKYYEDLFSSIPSTQQTPQLKKFLQETAQSEQFEFKVSKSFGQSQFKHAGMKLLESIKIWPNDTDDVGMFVEVWQN